MNNAVDGSASEHNAEKQDRNTITMCGAPLAPVGELSATVPWRSVDSSPLSDDHRGYGLLLGSTPVQENTNITYPAASPGTMTSVEIKAQLLPLTVNKMN